MKKVISLFLVLMMLCCGAYAEAIDVNGEWYADFFGMSAILTIDGEGYTMDLSGDISVGACRFDGSILYMDEGTDVEMQLPYDAANGVFVLDMGEGIIINFGREATAAFTPAELRTDAAIEDFAGEWITEWVDAFGMIMPPAMLGFSLDLDVEGSAVDLTIDLMGDLTEASVEAAFADGMLSVVVPGGEYNNDLTIILKAREDGSISADFDMLGEVITFYMGVAPEAA